jgi:hypothetical protein
MNKYNLSPAQIEQILKALAKGDRVELMPAKDGVKILSVHRDEIK